MGDVKAEGLIYKLHDTPPEAKADGLDDTLFDMAAKALVNTLAETPLERKAETFLDTMGNVKTKRSDTVGKTEAG